MEASSLPPAQARFRDYYTIGRVLGQGHFGIVYECTEKATGNLLAVKMVDKVKAPLDAIVREADILQSLDHPCVMKFRGMLTEQCFVCIVSDLYGGGDLIGAMLDILDTGEEIPADSAVCFVRQIIAAIAYLHEQKVMHRDVKGDNYLLDRPGLFDPDLQVVLCDFGSARAVCDGERVKERVGTPAYWSPQVYDQDYDLKADVWAAGILLYGVLAGDFPFSDGNDVRTREPRMPSTSTPAFTQLLSGMLCKSERKRLSAAECLAQDFLRSGDSCPPPASQATASPDCPTSFRAPSMAFKELCNPAVDQRRRELVERFAEASDAGSIDLSGPDFAATNRRTGKTTMYGWRDRHDDRPTSPMLSKRVKLAEDRGSPLEELVAGMLREHDVDTSQFGTGGFGSISQFAAELEQGTACLMLDASKHKTLVRIVNVVVARISIGSGQGARFLVQTAGQHSDGRPRAALNQFPGLKKAPHENTNECMRRLLAQTLKIPAGCVKFDASAPALSEVTYESPTYPGVRTVYRKEIVKGSITSSEPELLAQLGASGGDGTLRAMDVDNAVREFSWLSEAECAARGAALERQSQGLADSVFIEAPIRLETPDELAQILLAHGVDPAGFSDGTNSLHALLREMETGMCALEEKKDGTLLRIVQIVLVSLIKKDTGEMLVIVDQNGLEGDTTLPGEKFRPDENVFFAAKRFFSKTLRISDENLVSIDPTNVKVVQKQSRSLNFIGLPTLYRKYIVTATYG